MHEVFIFLSLKVKIFLTKNRNTRDFEKIVYEILQKQLEHLSS